VPFCTFPCIVLIYPAPQIIEKIGRKEGRKERQNKREKKVKS
jgi:hypothetical protein